MEQGSSKQKEGRNCFQPGGHLLLEERQLGGFYYADDLTRAGEEISCGLL